MAFSLRRWRPRHLLPACSASGMSIVVWLAGPPLLFLLWLAVRPRAGELELSAPRR